jgi:hypothetical protein
VALDFIAVNGANLSCNQGSTPSTLIVATSKNKAEAKNIGVISDTVVGTFGTCNLLGPGPCVPVIPGNWSPGCLKVTDGLTACIKKSDTLACNVLTGGIISISNAQQIKVKAE